MGKQNTSIEIATKENTDPARKDSHQGLHPGLPQRQEQRQSPHVKPLPAGSIWAHHTDDIEQVVHRSLQHAILSWVPNSARRRGAVHTVCSLVQLDGQPRRRCSDVEQAVVVFTGRQRQSGAAQAAGAPMPVG